MQQLSAITWAQFIGGMEAYIINDNFNIVLSVSAQQIKSFKERPTLLNLKLSVELLSTLYDLHMFFDV